MQDQCKAIPSPEILRNTFKRRMQKDNIVGTKIIRKEAALEIHSTTFEDRVDTLFEFIPNLPNLFAIDQV